jgi:hypothetical protein
MTITGWQTSQRQTTDGAVESEQRVLVDAPAVDFDAAGAAALGERYWREVRRATFGLVRTRQVAHGLELKVLGRGPALLVFSAPEVEAGAGSIRCTFPICGGLLTRRAAGELSFAQLDGDRIELRSAIRGFYPALAAHEGRRDWTGALYNLVQSRIHVAISRRYFTRLAAEEAR